MSQFVDTYIFTVPERYNMGVTKNGCSRAHQLDAMDEMVSQRYLALVDERAMYTMKDILAAELISKSDIMGQIQISLCGRANTLIPADKRFPNLLGRVVRVGGIDSAGCDAEFPANFLIRLAVGVGEDAFEARAFLSDMYPVGGSIYCRDRHPCAGIPKIRRPSATQ